MQANAGLASDALIAPIFVRAIEDSSGYGGWLDVVNSDVLMADSQTDHTPKRLSAITSVVIVRAFAQ